MSEDLVQLPIQRFQQGLIENDADSVLAALGHEFIMFNGNAHAHSG